MSPPSKGTSMQSTDYLSNEKRARPSGTHSTEVPLRTRIEYAPKDAPRMDASFACSSPMQNISGISVEPLLRINAKSQAVTGEPGRAGSSPIASAATTPQPAGRSRTNSAEESMFDCSNVRIVRLGRQARHDIGTAWKPLPNGSISLPA